MDPMEWQVRTRTRFREHLHYLSLGSAGLVESVNSTVALDEYSAKRPTMGKYRFFQHDFSSSVLSQIGSISTYGKCKLIDESSTTALLRNLYIDGFENWGDISIEPSLEEVKELAAKIGFELRDQRTVDTSYVGDEGSMLSNVYKMAFWTTTKVAQIVTSTYETTSDVIPVWKPPLVGIVQAFRSIRSFAG
ncbi:hypothetical protein PIIN_07428 [Serendipita indica DSM 11827]|uniref:Uncharacterized protein n=1 Tax=Serendipita indica (strain DSM 11827) TaxID=1109443 RepID=G4TQ81_SERID|nr:hypothetical protein PIIN_07428 [Serendipita indica DSM 11827]